MWSVEEKADSHHLEKCQRGHTANQEKQQNMRSNEILEGDNERGREENGEEREENGRKGKHKHEPSRMAAESEGEKFGMVTSSRSRANSSATNPFQQPEARNACLRADGEEKSREKQGCDDRKSRELQDRRGKEEGVTSESRREGNPPLTGRDHPISTCRRRGKPKRSRRAH